MLGTTRLFLETGLARWVAGAESLEHSTSVLKQFHAKATHTSSLRFAVSTNTRQDGAVKTAHNAFRGSGRTVRLQTPPDSNRLMTKRPESPSQNTEMTEGGVS
jgi:hypothetical protein